MAERYQIREFDSFTTNEKTKAENLVHISKKLFSALESFVLENKVNSGEDALELLSIGSKRGVGKVISAKNYVGVICMNDGTSIEILPKIYDAESGDYSKTRSMLLEMLKYTTDIPLKSFGTASLHTEKVNIYEIFISMFVKEVTTLYKRGIKSGYVCKQENETFCKGHILFNNQIKENIVHQERFFVEYDSFEINRPENKLIKSSLVFLHRITQDNNNKKNLERLINIFSDVEESKNIDADFAAVVIDRTMKSYEKIIKWCSIFLKRESFTSFYGSSVSTAILFPMEKVFEGYVAYLFSRNVDKKLTICTAQDKGHYLFEFPKKKFRLKPDIVLRKRNEDDILILDTKWKLISDEKTNYGIAQSDMYQMYAYSKKYKSPRIVLLYPSIINSGCQTTYKSQDNVNVEICTINIDTARESVKELVDRYHF